MFCMNCGTQLADGTVFCTSCGARLDNENQEMNIPQVPENASNNVYNQPEVAPVSQEAEAPISQGEVMQEQQFGGYEAQQPAYQQQFGGYEAQQSSYQQPAYQQQFGGYEAQQPSYQQPTYQQPAYQQQFGGYEAQQPAYQQQFGYNPQQMGEQMFMSTTAVKKVKSSKATIPAVIFAVVSVILSVMVGLYGFMTAGKVGYGIANVVFAITAVLVITYAVSRSSMTAILKGCAILGTTAVYVIFYAIDMFKDANDRIKLYFNENKKATGTDLYFGIIVYVLLVCFVVYAIINIIKCFTNSKNVSMAMVVLGYFAMLLMVVVFVVGKVSDMPNLLAFKFIPNTFGLAILVLADVFASISRAKKMED